MLGYLDTEELFAGQQQSKSKPNLLQCLLSSLLRTSWHIILRACRAYGDLFTSHFRQPSLLTAISALPQIRLLGNVIAMSLCSRSVLASGWTQARKLRLEEAGPVLRTDIQCVYSLVSSPTVQSIFRRHQLRSVWMSAENRKGEEVKISRDIGKGRGGRLFPSLFFDSSP